MNLGPIRNHYLVCPFPGNPGLCVLICGTTGHTTFRSSVMGGLCLLFFLFVPCRCFIIPISPFISLLSKPIYIFAPSIGLLFFFPQCFCFNRYNSFCSFSRSSLSSLPLLLYQVNDDCSSLRPRVSTLISMEELLDSLGIEYVNSALSTSVHTSFCHHLAVILGSYLLACSILINDSIDDASFIRLRTTASSSVRFCLPMSIILCSWCTT